MPHPAVAGEGGFWTEERLRSLARLAESSGFDFQLVSQRCAELYGLRPGSLTAEDCRAQYARLESMRSLRTARAASGRATREHRGGVLDIQGMRTAMRADVDDRRRMRAFSTDSGGGSSTGGGDSGEDGPSSFNIMEDSLAKTIHEIHRVTRMSLPSMTTDGDDDDDDEKEESDDDDMNVMTRREMKAASSSSNNSSPRRINVPIQTQQPSSSASALGSQAVVRNEGARGGIPQGGSNQAHDDDGRSGWGFHDWLQYQRDREDEHRVNQERVFARVRHALGDDMDVSQAVIEPTVQSAWDRRMETQAAKRLQEENERRERARLQELDDLFTQLRHEEQNPKYESGGHGAEEYGEGHGDEDNEDDDSPRSYHAERGLTMDIGMEERELDELLESLQANNQGERGSPSEMQSVLEILEMASSEHRVGNTQIRSTVRTSLKSTFQRAPSSGERSIGGMALSAPVMPSGGQGDDKAAAADKDNNKSEQLEEAGSRERTVVQPSDGPNAGSVPAAVHPRASDLGDSDDDSEGMPARLAPESGAPHIPSRRGPLYARRQRASTASSSSDDEDEEHAWVSRRQALKNRGMASVAATHTATSSIANPASTPFIRPTTTTMGMEGTYHDRDIKEIIDAMCGDHRQEGSSEEEEGSNKVESPLESSSDSDIGSDPENEEMDYDRQEDSPFMASSHLPTEEIDNISDALTEEAEEARLDLSTPPYLPEPSPNLPPCPPPTTAPSQPAGEPMTMSQDEPSPTRMPSRSERKAKLEAETEEAKRRYLEARRDFDEKLETLRVNRLKQQLNRRLEAWVRTRRVRAELNQRVETLNQSYRDYEEEKRQRFPTAEKDLPYPSRVVVFDNELPYGSPVLAVPPNITLSDQSEISVLFLPILPLPSFPDVLTNLTTASLQPVVDGKLHVLGFIMTVGCYNPQTKSLGIPEETSEMASQAAPGVLVAIKTSEAEPVQALEVLAPCFSGAGVVERIEMRCGSVDSTMTDAHQDSLAPLELFTSESISLRSFAFTPRPPTDHDGDNELETAVCLVKPHALAQPDMVKAITERVMNEGLYIAGARLVHLNADDWVNITLDRKVPEEFTSAGKDDYRPALVLALRGFRALYRWADAVGPEDPQLARCTDSMSLRARFGIDRYKNLVVSNSKNRQRSIRDMTFWFGGRCSAYKHQHLAASSFLYTVIIQPSSSIVLGLAMDSWATILQFLISFFGLLVKDLAVLDMAKASSDLQLPDLTSILMGKDRAVLVELEGEGAGSLLHMDVIKNRWSGSCVWMAKSVEEGRRALSAVALSCPVPTNDEALAAMSVGYDSLADVVTDPEVSQCVALAVLPDALAINAPFVGDLLSDLVSGCTASKDPISSNEEGADSDIQGNSSSIGCECDGPLELLGMRLVPRGDKALCQVLVECCYGSKALANAHFTKEMVDSLAEGPVIALVVRGVNAVKRIQNILGPSQYSAALLEVPESKRARFGTDDVHIGCLSTVSIRATHRFVCHLFKPDQLRADPNYRNSQDGFLPPLSSTIPFLQWFPSRTPVLETVAVVTPRAVAKMQLGRILRRLEREEFVVVDITMIKLHEAQAQELLRRNLGSSGDDQEAALQLASHLTQGPSVVLVLQRRNAVAKWVEVMGPMPQLVSNHSGSLGTDLSGQVLWSLRASFAGSSDDGKVMDPGVLGACCYDDVQALRELLLHRDGTSSMLRAEAMGKHASSSRLPSDWSGGDDKENGSRYFQRNGFSLNETVCLVLAPVLLKEHPLSTIIELLQQKEFTLVQCRTIKLSSEDASCYLAIHRGNNKEDTTNLNLPALSGQGHVVVLAVQSDNALARIQKLVIPISPSKPYRPEPTSYRSMMGYGLTHDRQALFSSTSQSSSSSTPFIDASGHQAGFASWTADVAGKELAFFFTELFGVDQILTGRQQPVHGIEVQT